jgi:hypothetical protein
MHDNLLAEGVSTELAGMTVMVSLRILLDQARRSPTGL